MGVGEARKEAGPANADIEARGPVLKGRQEDPPVQETQAPLQQAEK